jgi:hypothetical protein
MLQSAKSNQFRFNFPKSFVPGEISAKYSRYMNRIPGNIISDPLELLNYSVQSVTVPSFSYDPVQQVDFPGTKRQYRSSLPVTELFAKELRVGMQLFDGHFNYWMMYEIFQYYYDFREKQPYLPDGFRLQMIDGEGNILVTIFLDRVLFQSVPDLNLNFSSNTPEFKNFEVVFVYNNLKVNLEFQ